MVVVAKAQLVEALLLEALEAEPQEARELVKQVHQLLLHMVEKLERQQLAVKLVLEVQQAHSVLVVRVQQVWVLYRQLLVAAEAVAGMAAALAETALRL